MRSDGISLREPQAEAYHARAFLDVLAESRVDVRQDLTQPEREREDELFARISALQRDLWEEGISAVRRRELRAQLASAEDDLEAFRLELRQTNPRYASVQYPKHLATDDIQHQLL